jgi:hypothetical protein
MNGHESWSQFSRSLSKAIISNVSEVFEPSSSEEALKLGAYLVRQIFCYFEFDFRVGGVQLSDPAQRVRRFGYDRNLGYLVYVAHLAVLAKLLI